jgi:hypothetical protein
MIIDKHLSDGEIDEDEPKGAKSTTPAPQPLTRPVVPKTYYKPRHHKVGFAVSERGHLMITGLRRTPFYMYRKEWEALLQPDTADRMRQFIDEHRDELS